MVNLWIGAAVAAVPTLLLGRYTLARKQRTGNAVSLNSRRNTDTEKEPFVCERVCTSRKMLKKVGAFSKDPTPDTCVTVCGVSEEDACAEACRMSVCVNQHHVPNWNEVCMRRCTEECLKVR
eukprot:TRINITY_DN23782_c0_g1_i1.p1 TRINITY_DN23782_c0_g1~~TRINITY_DN23782_c0_g1_i1.p1  ORF type:complete len:122 (+),score=6.65 TRINITY_DN23782_c0_g1_i1:252-617(+)